MVQWDDIVVSLIHELNLDQWDILASECVLIILYVFMVAMC